MTRHAKRVPLAAIPRIRWSLLAITAVAVLLAACGERGARSVESPETIAVEMKAGDFADYWAEVVRLSRRHAAHPDSFRAAIDSLPGTHLTDEEWEAWVAPHRAQPGELATKLERTMAEILASQPPAAKPGPLRSKEEAPSPPEAASRPPSTSRSGSP